MTGMTWTTALTLGVALLGAVLGVINTVRSNWQDRVKLKVSVSRWVDASRNSGIALTVVNLSVFAVTVESIRVPISRKKDYFALDFIRELPKRLEPRTSHTFRFGGRAFEHPECPQLGRFRVNTACGVVRLSRKTTLE